jgi:hypothetical protein
MVALHSHQAAPAYPGWLAPDTGISTIDLTPTHACKTHPGTAKRKAASARWRTLCPARCSDSMAGGRGLGAGVVTAARTFTVAMGGCLAPDGATGWCSNALAAAIGVWYSGASGIAARSQRGAFACKQQQGPPGGPAGQPPPAVQSFLFIFWSNGDILRNNAPPRNVPA